jgi:hypothetical protein
MKMPKKLKAEWIKALRSGEYKQTKEVLCNNEGGFCCLGVLEHIVLDGEVEAKNDIFLEQPTVSFWKYAGIKLDKDDRNKVAKDIDTQVETLMYMNDGTYGDKKTFKQISVWIDENIEAY